MADDADYQPSLTPRRHAWRIALVLAISAAAWSDPSSGEWNNAKWLLAIDLSLGVISFGLMFLRRRSPATIAFVTSACSALSASSSGPAALALTSLATRRNQRQIALVAAVNFAGSMLFQVVVPVSHDSWTEAVFGALASLAAVVGWGEYVGSRRELMWNLRQRAERAERERDLRAAEARANERTRIAREMHDVVAHRISQVSMRAGAMTFRDDLTAEQMRAESTVIRDTANEALRELRSVLHVLRDAQTGDLVEQPQPTHLDIADLIERSRIDGIRIDFTDATTTPPSPEIGRTMYRMVQEGITNASKHAPGALLRVTLANETLHGVGGDGVGGDGVDGVVVTMSNPLGFDPTSAPGSGLGLIGIAERVAVAHGRFEHTESATEFVVTAWLPCQT